MIQSQLFLTLALDSDVADIVSTRIFPLRMPQKKPLPAVVYQQIGLDPVNSLAGDSGLDQVRMQLSCWARTYEQAVDLAQVVRNAITTDANLKALTDLVLDDADDDTLAYRIILRFTMWSLLSPSVAAQLATFERVTFEGTGANTEISLPSAISENGFYLVTLNGRVAKEGTTYTLSAGRDKVIFATPLTGGSFKDEGLIIYQSSENLQFAEKTFVGDGATTEIALDAAIVANGFYLVTLNGRVAKEGTTYTLSAGRDKVIFAAPLTGGGFPDEGTIIYQIA